MKKTPQEWIEEYSFLLKSSPVTPPERLGNEIRKTVFTDLNPSLWSVFCKLFAIHFVSGSLTLFLCPQFGVRIHSNGEAVLGFFSQFGEYACMLACGALFLGATGLFAALLLKTQEIRTIAQSRGLQWALLAFLSLGFFLSFREQEISVPIGLIVVWSIGALLGGFSVFRLSYSVRIRIRQLMLHL